LQMGRYEDALKELDVAVSLGPNALEPKFNRGLCYQKMLLIDSARREFTQLLSRETEEGWLAETRGRLEATQTAEAKVAPQVLIEIRTAEEKGNNREVGALLDRHFSTLLSYALSDLTGTYLESASASDVARARECLERMRLVGKAFAEQKHDSLI